MFCVVEGKRLEPSRLGKVGSSEAPSAALFNFPLATSTPSTLLPLCSNPLTEFIRGQNLVMPDS